MSEAPGITAVVHNATLSGDGTTTSPLSVVPSAAPPGTRAISAAGSGSKRHGPDLILSIISDGARVTLSEQPCSGWLTPLPPGAPIPITVNSLPPAWAHIVIVPHPAASPELIGGLPQIEVYLPSDAWRGSFAQLLDRLASSGMAVLGPELMRGGALQGAYLAWLARRHGGKTFGPSAPG